MGTTTFAMSARDFRALLTEIEREAMAKTTLPPPVLTDGVIYDAYDRFVCANVSCAGMTARYSGATIDGYRVRSVDRATAVAEVKAWRESGLDAPLCECGALKFADDGTVVTAEKGARQ